MVTSTLQPNPGSTGVCTISIYQETRIPVILGRPMTPMYRLAANAVDLKNAEIMGVVMEDPATASDLPNCLIGRFIYGWELVLTGTVS